MANTPFQLATDEVANLDFLHPLFFIAVGWKGRPGDPEL